MITIFRWILLPITLIYSFVIWLRNLFYDKGILKSTEFTIPTIVIGNLAIGGTGKSPTTEYIVRLLKDKYTIATLSRGYGRKTKGYRIVETNSLATEVGDEPLQFKKKFTNITVAVSEDRCYGINKLHNNHDVIVLDDAYQHRKLKAGFSILLFDFSSLFSPIVLLPTGNFRDNFSSTKRADLILITKCPNDLHEDHKRVIEHKIRRFSLSPIFYTAIEYDTPRDRMGNLHLQDLKNFDILLFCGIANPTPLEIYLTQLGNQVKLLKFPDHHIYTVNDFNQITNSYQSLSAKNKIIITTEKDMQRIGPDNLTGLPLYYIPIRLKSMDKQQETFDHFILNYLDNQDNLK